ncbi:MAG: rhodanese-like domain-containing protein [Candidatus Pelagibacter sp.]
MSLVTSDWLENNIDKVKLLDCSWHMPNVKRNSYEEYIKEHIPGAIFFDLDKYSDTKTDLPHMLPGLTNWEKIVSDLGIANDDRIIIYDNSDVLSSCRCWYNFIYFGHNPNLVSVLDGGFKKWNQENKVTTNNIKKLEKSSYTAQENKNLVKSKNQINSNINLNEFLVIDARSKERFEGKVPDPRKNVRSGSIPNSICLPFKEIINEDNTFKKTVEISEIFNQIIDFKHNNLVFSCGSGVTACVLALAYSIVNNTYSPTIYDGSWAEYGKI